MRFGVGFKLIEAMWNKAGVSNAQKKEKRRMSQAYHFIRAKLNYWMAYLSKPSKGGEWS